MWCSKRDSDDCIHQKFSELWLRLCSSEERCRLFKISDNFSVHWRFRVTNDTFFVCKSSVRTRKSRNLRNWFATEKIQISFEKYSIYNCIFDVTCSSLFLDFSKRSSWRCFHRRNRCFLSISRRWHYMLMSTARVNRLYWSF